MQTIDCQEPLLSGNLAHPRGAGMEAQQGLAPLGKVQGSLLLAWGSFSQSPRLPPGRHRWAQTRHRPGAASRHTKPMGSCGQAPA